jgi:Flp pilus assembly protein TadB
MPKRKKGFSPIDRAAAVFLAAVWIAGSLVAILAGLHKGLWTAVAVGLVGAWYGTLWLRAAHQGRYLRWPECVRPWRSR